MTVGVAYDGHKTRFTQREAESDLVPRGNSVGTQRTGAFETEVDVDTWQDNIGVYLTDTVDLFERVALTLAGRYQHVHIKIATAVTRTQTSTATTASIALARPWA